MCTHVTTHLWLIRYSGTGGPSGDGGRQMEDTDVASLSQRLLIAE